ncbi:MAG: Fic family protein [Elusimicrobia bacterium]|nr:Fic family protein [Elusimicrobiota bacterium]
MSFVKRIDKLSPEIWSKIIQIEGLKGQWISGAKLNPQILERLKKSVLVTSTGASTRIEGANLSDEDVEKVMNGLSIQKFADRDRQEVKGYYELLQNVFEAWRTISFSESAIKHFHKELLKYVNKDEQHRGEYKKHENKVHLIDRNGKSVGLLFDTTPAWLTSKEMRELVEAVQDEFRKRTFPPLLIIADFLVEFLLIHPFEDGNGRLSRILTNLLLLKNGYEYIPYVSHEKLVEDDKNNYYLALLKSQKTMRSSKPDITPWLIFFLNIIEKQAVMAIELLQKENVEKVFSPKQLLVWKYLVSVKQASPREISRMTKVMRPTVNQSLGKLLKLKKIERIGLGSATRYRIL